MLQNLLEMCLCKQSNSEPIHPATSLTGHLFWVIVNYTKHPRTRYQATKKGSSAPQTPEIIQSITILSLLTLSHPPFATEATIRTCPRLLLSVSVSSLTLVLPIVTLCGGPCLLCLGNCGQASSFITVISVSACLCVVVQSHSHF